MPYPGPAITPGVMPLTPNSRAGGLPLPEPGVLSSIDTIGALFEVNGLGAIATEAGGLVGPLFDGLGNESADPPMMEVHDAMRHGISPDENDEVWNYAYSRSSSFTFEWRATTQGGGFGYQLSQPGRNFYAGQFYAPWTDAPEYDDGVRTPLGFWQPSWSGYATPPGAVGWEVVEPGGLVDQDIVVFGEDLDGNASGFQFEQLVFYVDGPRPDGGVGLGIRDAVRLAGNALGPGWGTTYCLGSFFLDPSGYIGPQVRRFAPGFEFAADGFFFGLHSPVLYPGGPDGGVQILAEQIDYRAIDPTPFPQRFNDELITPGTEYAVTAGARPRAGMGFQYRFQPPTFRWVYADPPRRPAPLLITGRDDHLGGGTQIWPPPSSRQGGRVTTGYL